MFNRYDTTTRPIHAKPSPYGGRVEPTYKAGHGSRVSFLNCLSFPSRLEATFLERRNELREELVAIMVFAVDQCIVRARTIDEDVYVGGDDEERRPPELYVVPSLNDAARTPSNAGNNGDARVIA